MKGPRLLKKAEKLQRGCDYCTDCIKLWQCPFEVCPYHTLDEFVKFQDWMRANAATVPHIIRRLKGKA